MDMVTIFRTGYILLLSYNPCDIFDYFNVDAMHGLNKIDCAASHNTPDSAYIAGWCNFVPKESGEYTENDRRFIFINLTRCNDDIAAMGLIMHEMMHQSLFIHNNDVINKEEEIISWAEAEAYEVFHLMRPFKSKIVRQAITVKSE
jgi:hypothetical protein